MHKKSMVVGAVLCLLAIGTISAWPIWQFMQSRPVNIALYERTKAVATRNAELQALWAKAIEDGKLTRPEATEIIEKAGEKVGPAE